MTKNRTGMIDRVKRLLGRRSPRRVTTDGTGPQVDLLRQRVAERRPESLALTDGHEPARPSPSEPELLNFLLPVRREAEALDASVPVELRRGPSPDVLSLVEAETAHAERILPYRLDEITRTLCVAVDAELATRREQALRALVRARLGYSPQISYYTTSPDVLSRLLRRYYEDSSRAGLVETSGAVEALTTPAARRSVVETTGTDGETRGFVLNLLAYAMQNKASDVIIAPHKARTALSLITERGKEEIPVGRELARESGAYLSRIVKQLCEPPLDVLKTRGTQKGTISLTIETPAGPVDLSARVNITPNQFGEFIVMRLFDDGFELDFETLVTCPWSRRWITWAVEERQGILLFSSPPGSGKSTLQHAILRPPLLPKRDNVLTIENPIERYSPYVEQFAVTEHVSQDELLNQHMQNMPHRMMIGEVTLASTAKLLFMAARSSVQMFSTTHANSAAKAVERLMDLGIERKEIAESVKVLVGQRLLDRTCKACLAPVDVPDEALIYAQLHTTEVDAAEPMEGEGCNVCDGTGVVGKVAVIETIPVSPEIAEIIRTAPPETLVDDVTLAAIKLGMTPLRRHAIALYLGNEIPARELARVERLAPEQAVAWWNLHRRAGFRLLKPGDTAADEGEAR